MRMHEATAPRIRGLDKENTLVLLPISACEQHGPHMPTGTDAIICGSVAEAVEANRPDRILLLPTLWLGASQHHLRFGATLTATLPTYVTLLCELLDPLLSDGFRRAMILNGHGGNVDPLRVALRELQPRFPNCVLSGGSYWSTAEKEIADALEGEAKGVGHACEMETSLVMHLRPELVDESALENCGLPKADTVHGLYLSQDMHQRTRNGATGRPDLATAAKGKQMFEGIVARVTEAVDGMLAEALPS